MQIFYPLVGAMFLAGKVKTALAASKLKLYKDSLVPSQATTHADLVAAVADFDGYADATITNFLAPYKDPGGGASIQSGTQQFDYVDSTGHVTNSIGGAWLEDSTGKLVCILKFAEPKQMLANGDSIPIDLVLNYGNSG